MSAKTAFTTTQPHHILSRIASANSRFSMNYAALMASLGAAALLCFPSTNWAQSAPPLGTVQSFAVLGGSAVTAAGPVGTVISGDVGSAPTPTITGFPPAAVAAGFTLYTAANAVTTLARTDAGTAYGNLAAQICPAANIVAGGNLGGLNLVPGVYCMPTGNLVGTLTLTGSATDVWVFQITLDTLTTAGASQVVMGGAANPCNVYWQVSSSATLGAASTFRGNIFSGASISLGTTTNVVGRAIAGTGAVTMAGSDTVGGCSLAVPPTTTTTAAPTTTTLPATTTTTAPTTTTTTTASTTTTTVPIVPPAPANTAIPTLSEWAMILLAALLAIVGLVAIRGKSR